MHEGFAFITIDENDLPYRSVGSFRDFRSEYDVCSSHKQSWSLLKSRNTGSNPRAGVLTFDYFQRRMRLAVQEDMPKREFWRGLTVCGLCTCFASIWLHAIMQAHPHFSGDIFLTASLRYRYLRRVRGGHFLLHSIRSHPRIQASLGRDGVFHPRWGLCGPGSGGLSDRHSGGHSWILTVAWLVAAVLFQSAGHAQSLWKVETKRQKLAQMTLAALMVAAFPAAAVPYALDRTILPALTTSSDTWFQAAVFGVIAAALAPGIILAALVAYYRRYHTEDDRLTGLLCYFFVPCAFGLASGALSTSRFDEWWTVEQILIGVSWLTLMAGIGVGNAFADKEVGDRIEELEALRDISWALVGTGSFRQLCEKFAETLTTRLDAKITGVFIADDNGAALEMVAIHGSAERQQNVGTSYPITSKGHYPGFHSGHTARAFITREVQVAHEVFVDVELVPWRVIAVDKGCAVSLPLVGRASAMGVLDVYFSDARQLGRQRLMLLNTIAASAGPAIENARAGESAPEDEQELDLAA